MLCSSLLQPKNAEEMKDIPSMREDSRDRRTRKKMMNKIGCMVESEMCRLNYTVLKLSVRWWRSNKWPQSSPLPQGVLFVLTTLWTVTDAPLWRWTSCSHIHNKFGPLGMCCLYTLAEWDCPQEGCGGVSGLVATCFLLLLAQKYPRLLDWDHSL